MKQLTILGSGAAPGVPSLGRGWGACDPQNPKNRRLRTSAYLEYDGVRLLIDTSPDLRLQLLAMIFAIWTGCFTHMRMPTMCTA